MWVRIAILAGAYFIVGRLALLMAIPPGFATAFWPASGIALAGLLVWGFRAWPGVLIGSFLVNVGTTFDTSSISAVALSLIVPTGIAAGATLQAMAGAALAQWLVGYPTPLNREQEVAGLLIVVVPVSCLVNGTLSTLLLWASGRIDVDELGFTVWTWWVGDTIGAFLVTPVVLVWTFPANSEWIRRSLTVSIPLAILAAVVVILFVYVEHQESERMRYDFESRTQTLSKEIQIRLESALGTLNAMRGFHGNDPSKEEQRRFVRSAHSVLARQLTVVALAWSPRIKDSERAEFERKAKASLVASFAIHPFEKDAETVLVARRTEFFPLLYREPPPPKPGYFGIDLSSEAARLKAMESAALNAEPMATGPISGPGAGDGKNMLVFLPIFREGAAPDREADRSAAITGYVVAVLRMSRLVDLTWQSPIGDGINCWLHDETDPGEKKLAYSRIAPRGADDNRRIDYAGAGLEQTTRIEIAGRRWSVRYLMTPQYLNAHRSLQAWSVLAGGMLLTGLLGGVLLVITGRAAHVTRLVDERTAELHAANTAMTAEIAERKRAEETLRAREDSLRESEERFRLLVEGTTDYAMYMIDSNGVVMSWNRGAERIKGYRADEIIGKSYSCFFTEADRQTRRFERALKIARETGSHEDEGWRVRKDGALIWVHASITPMRDSAGNIKGFWKITRDLTKHKQADEELRTSEERFRVLTQSINDAVISADIEGNIVFWNKSAERIFGYSEAEILGKPVAYLIPEQFREAHRQWLENVRATGQSYLIGNVVELAGLRKDGRQFPIELSLAFWEAGQGKFFSGIVRDITDRKRTEARFRGLLESAPDAIVIVQEDGKISLVNRQTEQMFGYHRDELLGEQVEMLVPERLREQHRTHRSAYAGSPTARPMGATLTLYGRRKDGSEFPIEISLSPLVTDGQVLVTSAIRDITERKRSEAALDQSRRFVARIADMIPSILYVYDLESQRNIFVNPRIESVLGYSVEDTMKPGMKVLQDKFHPDDAAKLEWLNEQYQTIDDNMVVELEYRIQNADGDWRWFHSRTMIFVRDAEGNPLQVLGTAQDITERKRLEQEVLEIAAVEQRRIGQELHDGTGQELTGLCMLADNLAEALEDRAPTESAQAARIANGLRQALMQVRALSRGLIPVEVDAEGLMAALTELTQRISELHGVECVFECVETVEIEDNFTATQLYRIAQEAITNSLKHGKARNIRVTLETKGHYITLKVADDGVGFPDMDENQEGMGLRIMRYRAGQIGALFSVRPGTTQGTVITGTLFRGSIHE